MPIRFSRTLCADDREATVRFRAGTAPLTWPEAGSAKRRMPFECGNDHLAAFAQTGRVEVLWVTGANRRPKKSTLDHRRLG
jgi:hypothetical protein